MPDGVFHLCMGYISHIHLGNSLRKKNLDCNWIILLLSIQANNIYFHYQWSHLANPFCQSHLGVQQSYLFNKKRIMCHSLFYYD